MRCFSLRDVSIASIRFLFLEVYVVVSVVVFALVPLCSLSVVSLGWRQTKVKCHLPVSYPREHL